MWPILPDGKSYGSDIRSASEARENLISMKSDYADFVAKAKPAEAFSPEVENLLLENTERV